MASYRIDFDFWVTTVENRRHRRSSIRRMVDCLDLEIHIPFTDRHLLVSVTSHSHFRDVGDDAWKITWGDDAGWPSKELMFPDGSPERDWDLELRMVPKDGDAE